MGWDLSTCMQKIMGSYVMTGVHPALIVVLWLAQQFEQKAHRCWELAGENGTGSTVVDCFVKIWLKASHRWGLLSGPPQPSSAALKAVRVCQLIMPVVNWACSIVWWQRERSENRYQFWIGGDKNCLWLTPREVISSCQCPLSKVQVNKITHYFVQRGR